MDHHRWVLSPALGWNSWDCYGASVREDEVRGNAEYMAANLVGSRGATGKIFRALFNVGDSSQSVSVTWEQLGIRGPQSVRDLWNQKDECRAAGVLERTLAPHSSALFALT